MSHAKYQSVCFDYSINILWLLLLYRKTTEKPAKVNLESRYNLETMLTIIASYVRLRNLTGSVPIPQRG